MNKFNTIQEAAEFCGCLNLLSGCPEDLMTRTLKQPITLVDTLNECFGTSKRRKGYYTVQEFSNRCSTKVHSKTYGELPQCFYGFKNEGDDSKLLGRTCSEKELENTRRSVLKYKSKTL